MTSPEELRKWVDRQYEDSEDNPWGLEWRPSQKLRYKVILDAINNSAHKKPLSILDIGCSTGDFLNEVRHVLGNSGHSYSGIDISGVAIKRAIEKYPELSFRVSSAGELANTAAHSFDMIICLETLYYLEEGDRVPFLEDINKLLTENGTAIFSSLNKPYPYLDYKTLEELLSGMFTLDSSGKLNLKVLSGFERLVGAVAGRLPAPAGRLIRKSVSQIFRPAVVSAINKLSGTLLGERSMSHSYFLARTKK